MAINVTMNSIMPTHFNTWLKRNMNKRLDCLNKNETRGIIKDIENRNIEKEEKEKRLLKYDWLIKKLEKRENEDLVAARERLNIQ